MWPSVDFIYTEHLLFSVDLAQHIDATVDAFFDGVGDVLRRRLAPP